MDWDERNTYVAIFAAFLLGLAARILAKRSSLIDGGVLFDGYDSFYHMRRILYGIENFPRVLWSDSYLNYPFGLELTWPPLFDQFVAGVCLLLGARTQAGAEIVGALIPPILGSLTIVAVYFLVRRLLDSKTAVLAAFLTAIAPYSLQKSAFGAMDHHSMETLFLVGTLALLAYALDGVGRRYAYAALAGLMMAALAYTWLGSAAYFGTILLYGLVQMTLNLREGTSSRDMAGVLLVAYVVALAILVPFWNGPWWAYPSFVSLLAIVVALALFYGISQLFLDRKVPWAVFPVLILVLAYALVIFSHVLSGAFWPFAAVDNLVRQGMDYLFGGGMTGRIAEAEPIYVNVSFISNFGANLFLSTVGLLFLIYRMATRGWNSPQVLFLVWTLVVLAMTIGQKRFLYLYSINMAILISILFFEVVDLIRRRDVLDPKISKAVSAVLLLVLVLPSAAEVVSIAGDRPAIAGDWYGSLKWLEENSEPTSYFDAPFEVPEYSVFTWWDYGNWVLYEARRPVVANNFQAGVVDSSRFYLSEDEATATSILDSRGSRYVVTDFEMLYGKLAALTSWIGEDPKTYVRTDDLGGYVNVRPLQRLMSTTLAGLHLMDCNRMGHFRLIYESDTSLGVNPPVQRVKIFEYVPGAVITGTTGPEEPVGAILNMTSNQGRSFQYFNFGAPENGRYEIRLPYSTEPRYETHATGKYSIFSAGKRVELEVSEEDVTKGRVIEVNF